MLRFGKLIPDLVKEPPFVAGLNLVGLFQNGKVLVDLVDMGRLDGTRPNRYLYILKPSL